MRRRSFLKSCVAASPALLHPGYSASAEDVAIGKLETHVPVRAITSQPDSSLPDSSQPDSSLGKSAGENSSPTFHWFGYYDKQEFDPTGRYVLSNQVGFEGRSPTASDSIQVGLVDTEDNDRWQTIGQSRAWGWQQGCMLQFVGNNGSTVLWNDRQDDQFVCRVHDLKSKTTRTIDLPIYTISRDGRYGLSADFRRIDNLRPGYGYDGLADPFVTQHAPEESGVWRVDLATGEKQLILSLAQVAKIPWPDGKRHSDAWHYFNHLLINPAGDRFIVLHRYRPKFDPQTLQYQGGFVTRMLTANMDGSDVHVLDPSGYTSHFIWKDNDEVTMWTRPIGKKSGFYVMKDHQQQAVPIGAEKMPANGHNTYLNGDYGDWILNDTYPSKRRRQTVYLYHVPSDRRFDLGHFPSPPRYKGEWRCDTHPRSSVDGRTVAIDSPHDGGRQVYLLDIKDVLEKNS